MKPFKQFVLPELMGFFSAAAANGLSLLLFVWGGPLITGSMRLPFGLSLSLMMTLSAFLLFAAMLCGGKLSGDTKNLSEKLSFSYTSLFLLGAAVAAVLSIILALKTDIVGAETLVMVCYMIVCDMVLLLAFLLVVFILGKLLKVTGKETRFPFRPEMAAAALPALVGDHLRLPALLLKSSAFLPSHFSKITDSPLFSGERKNGLSVLLWHVFPVPIKLIAWKPDDG